MSSEPPKAPPDGGGSTAGRPVATEEEPQTIELQAELVSKLQPYVLGKQRAQRAAEAVLSVVVSETYHSGPLSPARELVRYNEAVENGAERIVAVAEREQRFDHEQATKAIDANIRFAGRGQVFALLATCGFIGGGIFCAVIGAQIVGVAMVSAGAVGIVAAFLRQGSNKPPSAPDPPEQRKPLGKKPRSRRN